MTPPPFDAFCNEGQGKIENDSIQVRLILVEVSYTEGSTLKSFPSIQDLLNSKRLRFFLIFQVFVNSVHAVVLL